MKKIDKCGCCGRPLKKCAYPTGVGVVLVIECTLCGKCQRHCSCEMNRFRSGDGRTEPKPRAE